MSAKWPYLLIGFTATGVSSVLYYYLCRIRDNSKTLNPSIGEEILLSDDLPCIIDEAVTWASAHGLLMINGLGHLAPAPFSLVPVQVPRAAFQDIIEIAPLMNTLYDRIARNDSLLTSILDQVIQFDPFTSKLMEIYEDVGKQNIIDQPLTLGLYRSDYMLHESEAGPCFKQVEFNTISSAFGHLSSIVTRLHEFILSKFVGHKVMFPHNDVMSHFAAGLASAVNHYPDVHSLRKCIVMVVQPGDRNSFDQKGLEYSLWESYGIVVHRLTLADIIMNCVLIDNHLVFNHSDLVCVTYFRAGYTPNDYPSEVQWNSRKLIESSISIKCPQIAYQLAGTKRIQQELCNFSVLETLVGDKSAHKLAKFFARQWNFEDANYKSVVAKGTDNPQDYVLKPQREGGGNNFYGVQMKEKLLSLSEKELRAFVLMEKLKPKPHAAVSINSDTSQHHSHTLSEFGIYSVHLTNGKKSYINRYSGHLVRTKDINTNEGGVASGFAVLDSPWQIEDYD